MSTAESIPVCAPDLGVEAVRIVQWLVARGGAVVAGDRVAELLAGGVLFHLTADVSGVIQRIDRERDHVAQAGEPLAWIEPEAA